MTRDVTASTNNVGPCNVSSKGLDDWFSSDEKLRKNREQAVAVTWAVFRKDRELFLVPLLAMVLVVVVMGSAGCMGPEGPSTQESDSLPTPAALQAPAWEIGDEWHYLSEQGRWRNETVVAIEDYNGHQVYRVEVVYSTQDEFGVSKSIFLLDVESLGIFSHYEEDGAGVKIHPPANQLFPMVNRSYEINIQYSWGQEDRHEITSKIDGWKDFEAQWGIVPSVKVTIKIEKLEQTALDGQYNPDIGNYVRRTAGHHDEYYTLMSWYKANSHQ